MTSAEPPVSPGDRFIFPAASSKMRRSLTLPATYATAPGPSPFSTPAKTRTPRPISPTIRPSSRTRPDVTRWTPARLRSLPLTVHRFPSRSQRGHADLMQSRDVLLFNDFRGGLQARIEKVARRHVRKGLEHRILHADVVTLEIHEQLFDALAL